MAAPAVGVAANKPIQKFPTIPVPGADVESLHKTALALKQAVEMLTGGDGRSVSGNSADRFAPHVFVQPGQPVALHVGDLWLCQGDSFTFNIWDGTRWLVIATLPPLP